MTFASSDQRKAVMARLRGVHYGQHAARITAGAIIGSELYRNTSYRQPIRNLLLGGGVAGALGSKLLGHKAQPESRRATRAQKMIGESKAAVGLGVGLALGPTLYHGSRRAVRGGLLGISKVLDRIHPIRR